MDESNGPSYHPESDTATISLESSETHEHSPRKESAVRWLNRLRSGDDFPPNLAVKFVRENLEDVGLNPYDIGTNEEELERFLS